MLPSKFKRCFWLCILVVIAAGPCEAGAFAILGCVSKPQELVESAEYAATFSLKAKGNGGGAEKCLLDCKFESDAAQVGACVL